MKLRNTIVIVVFSFLSILSVVPLVNAGPMAEPMAATGVKVTLSIDNAEKALTQQSVLTATVTPSVPVTKYIFEITRSNIIPAAWPLLDEGPNNSMIWTRRVAGRFFLRVRVITSDSNVHISNTVYATSIFPSSSTILAQTTVTTAMLNSWDSTKAFGTATQFREEGFYILLDTAGNGTYSVTATTPGTIGVPNVNNELSVAPPRPADDPVDPMPNASGKYAVGLFHTHPPREYVNQATPTGPSTTDQTNVASHKLPCFVYDYIPTLPNNYVHANLPLDSDARVWDYGYVRRELPR